MTSELEWATGPHPEIDGTYRRAASRTDHPARAALLWVSGPNEGYGLASAEYGREGQTDVELEVAIRNFLSQVDPSTGYVG